MNSARCWKKMQSSCSRSHFDADSEELERQVVQIMQLIGVREGIVVLPGFTRDDVDQLLDVLTNCK